MSNEVAFSLPMALSAFWTAITADTLLPSLVGAGFAVHFRHERDKGQVTKRDVIATVGISVIVGLIVGPYLADQLPESKHAIGVGVLIASFMGVPFLRALMRLDVGKIVDRLSGQRRP